jgi:rhomboid protease GluP
MTTNSLKQKLRLIYLPFLIIAISFIVLYTFLRWLLFIKFNILDIKEDLLNFWLPFGLPWIPLLIWLRPRAKLLKRRISKNGRKNDPVFGYLFFASFVIAAPTIIAQLYIETATGKLTSLNSINEINNNAPTKYYTIKNYYIDKKNCRVKSIAAVTGKYNEYLDLNIYIASPIYSAPKIIDTTNNLLPPPGIIAPAAWLCVKYYKQVSNHLSDDVIREEENEFYNETAGNFNDRNLDSFVYLDRISHNTDQDGYKKAIEKFQGIPATPIILEPHFDAFENRNGKKFPWIFGAFAIGMALMFLMLLAIGLDDDKVNNYLGGHPVIDSDNKAVLKLFIPKEGFFITPIIMYINIAVFVAMVCAGLGFASFDVQDLLKWGADYGPYTTNGQWWRLLTSTFVHAGIMHLFANMYGLLFVGIFLEPVIGKTKYLISYLTTGILASAVSLYCHPYTVSIGASGAIFGLYGVFVALLLMKVFPKNVSKAFLINASIFIVYNLVIGLTGKGTDNAAHIGGLLSGFFIGLLLHPFLTINTDYGTADDISVDQ